MAIWPTVRFAIRSSQLAAIGTWQPRSIDRLQQRRLRHLVRYAARHSAFYRHRFRGIDLADFQLTDLPPTRKVDIADNFTDALTDPSINRADLQRFLDDPRNLGRWFQGRYAVSRTSGSQGVPLTIVQDRGAIELLFALMSARGNSTGRPTPLEGLRRLRSPVRIAVVASQCGFYPSGAAFEFMPEIVGRFAHVQRFAAQQPDLFARLRGFQPNILVAYATILDALAGYADDLQLTELRQTANSSEQLTSQARRRIETAFGVPVLDHYATGECLFLSDGCARGPGAHINADWSILEVVDDEYRPVPPGEVGKKVLITNLANYVQPFIRYEVDDRLALATGPCACGSRLPRIARIDGRSGDLFWVGHPGNYRMLSGVLFHAAADAVPAVRQWQAVQQERNRIELRVQLDRVGAGTSSATERALRNSLRAAGLPEGVDIDFRLMPSLSPDDATGKLRRMISKVGAPARTEPASTWADEIDSSVTGLLAGVIPEQ